MSIRAAMVSQAGIHQTQTIQKLRTRAEGAANTGHAGTLMQRQRRRHIQRLIHLRLRSLCHPPTGIRGKGFKVAARAFRIQYAQCQRGLARPRHAGYADDLSQRDVDIHVLQIMHPRAADLDMVDH